MHIIHFHCHQSHGYLGLWECVKKYLFIQTIATLGQDFKRFILVLSSDTQSTKQEETLWELSELKPDTKAWVPLLSLQKLFDQGLREKNLTQMQTRPNSF